MKMSAIVLVLMSLFLSSTAIASNRDVCLERYPGDGSQERLKQIICIQTLDIKDLNDQLRAGEKGMERKLTQLVEALEATQAKLQQLERAQMASSPTSRPTTSTSRTATTGSNEATAARIARLQNRLVKDGDQPKTNPESQVIERVNQALNTNQPPQPPNPQPPTQPQAGFVPKQMVGFAGVPYSVAPAPGQYAAATFDPGGPLFQINRLFRGAERWVPGAVDVRILVQKNGSVISVGNDDPVNPWTEIYADLNKDGHPDKMVYKAVDPSVHEEVNIAMVGPRDRIRLIFLTDTGKRVLVQGFPPQILWGNPVRVSYEKTKTLGRWVTQAFTGSRN